MQRKYNMQTTYKKDRVNVRRSCPKSIESPAPIYSPKATIPVVTIFDILHIADKDSNKQIKPGLHADNRRYTIDGRMNGRLRQVISPQSNVSYKEILISCRSSYLLKMALEEQGERGELS